MILLFVALVIAILAVLSLGLAGLATLEHKAVITNGHSAQLVQIVQSGIDAAAKAIDDPEHPDLLDNPHRFQSVEVVPAHLMPRDYGAGRFTIFSPRLEQDQVRSVRFGLTRESAKLSLEAILAWEMESAGQGVRALEKLPNITPIVIDSILDWLDADDVARPQGAEVDYYKDQQKTYRPRNAVPITLEELLFIRDVKRTMIYGEDYPLAFGARQSILRRKSTLPDGSIDPFAPLPMEFDHSSLQTASDASSWQFLLTPYSAEKIVAKTKVNEQLVGKVYLNESNLEFLESQLRQHQLDETSIQFVMLWRNTNGNIDDPLDLLDAEITANGGTMPSPFSCGTPAAFERFLRLLDEATTDYAIVIRGRINVNEAPRLVLETVPELTPQMVTRILESRKTDAETQRHAVWLLAEGIVDDATMRILSRRLTTGGDVYRIQVAGFFEGKPMLQRAEAILDATVKPPKVVFYKDLSPLDIPE